MPGVALWTSPPLIKVVTTPSGPVTTTSASTKPPAPSASNVGRWMVTLNWALPGAIGVARAQPHRAATSTATSNNEIAQRRGSSCDPQDAASWCAGILSAATSRCLQRRRRGQRATEPTQSGGDRGCPYHAHAQQPREVAAHSGQEVLTHGSGQGSHEVVGFTCQTAAGADQLG